VKSSCQNSAQLTGLRTNMRAPKARACSSSSGIATAETNMTGMERDERVVGARSPRGPSSRTAAANEVDRVLDGCFFEGFADQENVILSIFHDENHRDIGHNIISTF
jgi:hypothetical protein